MPADPPRLAVRALILHEAQLLLVNAYPGEMSDLWCAPGGGVERGVSLADNLRREVHEETGLVVTPGALALVNEFHDPGSDFHQVELFFRCGIESGRLDPDWSDPEGVVNRRRFVTATELGALRHKPDSLRAVAFSDDAPATYDPLETLVR